MWKSNFIVHTTKEKIFLREQQRENREEKEEAEGDWAT